MPALAMTSGGTQTRWVARAGGRLRGLEQAAHGCLAWLADRVDDTANPVVCGMQQPGREVAAVDVLQGQIGRARREHVAAALDPPQPPGHPAGDLIGAEDQARTREQGPAAERLHRRQPRHPAWRPRSRRWPLTWDRPRQPVRSRRRPAVSATGRPSGWRRSSSGRPGWRAAGPRPGLRAAHRSRCRSPRPRPRRRAPQAARPAWSGRRAARAPRPPVARSPPRQRRDLVTPRQRGLHDRRGQHGGSRRAPAVSSHHHGTRPPEPAVSRSFSA